MTKQRKAPLVPNRKLRLARLQRGWTQGVEARLIEESIRAEQPGWSGLPTKQHVSRWEKGEHPEPIYFRHIVCVFEEPPEALGLVEEDQPSVLEPAKLYGMDLSEPVSRRGVLGGILGVGAWALFPSTASRSDRRAVDAYAALVAEDEALYWTRPPRELIPSVHERVRTGLYLLSQHDDPELAVSVARSALLAGRLAYFDLDNQVAAAIYWREAVRLAEAAHDTRMLAVAYGHLSFGRNFGGDDDALDVARLHARNGSGPLTRAWLHCVTAEVTARRGDHQRAIRQIRIAEEDLSTHRGSDPDWLDFFDHRRLDGFAGQIYLLAGRHEKAVGVLQTMLAGPLDQRQQAVTLLDLASASAPVDPRLALNQADAALALLDQDRRYPPAVGRLPGVRAALAHTAVGPEFDEHLVASGLAA